MLIFTSSCATEREMEARDGHTKGGGDLATFPCVCVYGSLVGYIAVSLSICISVDLENRTQAELSPEAIYLSRTSTLRTGTARLYLKANEDNPSAVRKA